MDRAEQVAIVGAGVVGLVCALELAALGFRVTVLESGRAMEQASWAAAGMLAVDDPENPAALLPLSRLSSALYPAFLARVGQLSGYPVPLRTHQTLQAVAAVPSSSSAGLPALRTDRYSWKVLEEASLDPRDLCAALPRAVRAAGVSLRERSQVDSISFTPDGMTLHLFDGGSIPADLCVIASGAWSAQLRLPGLPVLPVAPRKGQMIEVTLDGPLLPMVVRTPELYLVPRGDGRVVIGATVEHAGFDRAIDEEAGDRLWKAAAALWPPILKGHISARWTGLRPGFAPGIADALPVIGPLTQQLDSSPDIASARPPGRRIWLATAHFRNGILLAPGTARVVGELLTGNSPSVSLDAFSPERLLRQA